MAFGCITEDYKNVLHNLIANKIAYESIGAIVDTIPLCEREKVTAPGRVSPRPIPARWPSVVYHNEKGEATEFDSPSALHKKLFDEPVSGQVCSEDGTSCRALSLVDNFKIRGFIVRGDGEEAPVPAGDMTRKAIEHMYDDWKSKLLNENKKFIVFHPGAPEIKAASKEAEKKPRKITVGKTFGGLNALPG